MRWGFALASLRGIDGSHFELIDIDGLEPEDVDPALVSEHPTVLVGQWILELVMVGEGAGHTDWAPRAPYRRHLDDFPYFCACFLILLSVYRIIEY